MDDEENKMKKGFSTSEIIFIINVVIVIFIGAMLVSILQHLEIKL